MSRIPIPGSILFVFLVMTLGVGGCWRSIAPDLEYQCSETGVPCADGLECTTAGVCRCTPSSCPAGSCCSDDARECLPGPCSASCDFECNGEDDRSCEDGTHRLECSLDANSCWVWSEPILCDGSDECHNGRCAPPCSPGCNDPDTWGCPSDTAIGYCTTERGCLGWQEVEHCEEEERCVEGLCEDPCLEPCEEVGDLRCPGDRTYQLCQTVTWPGGSCLN